MTDQQTKKATKKRSPTKCKCVDAVNEQLKERGCEIERNIMFNFEKGTGGLSGPIVLTKRIKGHKGQIPTLYCSYCPFCGKKQVKP